MPEYLAPGVVVEEVSFRSKSIEGVATTTTGLIGPTRMGPARGEPEVLTSLEEFERTYGDGRDLDFAGSRQPNYMWHAAARFFDLGGRRLYVQRVAGPGAPGSATVAGLKVDATTPGAAGNGEVSIRVVLGPNLVSEGPDGTPRVGTLRPGDLVWIGVRAHADPVDVDTSPVTVLKPDTSPPEPVATATTSMTGRGFVEGGDFATATQIAGGWEFTTESRATISLVDAARTGTSVRAVTLTLERRDGSGVVASGIDPNPDRREEPDSVFGSTVDGPFRLVAAANATAFTVLRALGDGVPAAAAKQALFVPDTGVIAQRTVTLKDGTDGALPGDADYRGTVDANDQPSGLRALERIEEISIIAAPGHTHGYLDDVDRADAISQALIAHAERVRYCIAVLDSGDDLTIGQVQAQKAAMDSSHAALYYPWVTVLDPFTRKPLNLPPSCFVPGIYARNDNARGVWKAPANEVVTGALDFERRVSHGQQEVLNPLGVNCFRFFEGRGFRLWGARTISSDPEWKYVNLRRYFAYLERSIDRGTQWAVFEPNGPALWANVRRTISDFLFNEFVSGALLGDKPEQAYFVRCDRSTMTQNDLDNGRLICLVGVSPLRPAEFVIFRVGQWTADRR